MRARYRKQKRGAIQGGVGAKRGAGGRSGFSLFSLSKLSYHCSWSWKGMALCPGRGQERPREKKRGPAKSPPPSSDSSRLSPPSHSCPLGLCCALRESRLFIKRCPEGPSRSGGEPGNHLSAPSWSAYLRPSVRPSGVFALGLRPRDGGGGEVGVRAPFGESATDKRGAFYTSGKADRNLHPRAPYLHRNNTTPWNKMQGVLFGQPLRSSRKRLKPQRRRFCWKQKVYGGGWMGRSDPKIFCYVVYQSPPPF